MKIEIDDLIKFLKKRRSIRRLCPDPIPDEYIEKMIEAARWSPSGANAQPWEFIIVKDPNTINSIAKAYQQERHEQYVIEQTRVPEVRHHQLVSPPNTPPTFKDAPVLIVVCGDKRTFQGTILATRFTGAEGSPDGTYLKNMGNAVYSLMLAATALGLGSQWVSISTVCQNRLRPILDVPPMIEIHTIVPVGYPAYKPAPSYRRELNEIIYFEKYDTSKYRSAEEIVEFIQELRGRTKAAYAPEKETKDTQ